MALHLARKCHAVLVPKFLRRSKFILMCLLYLLVKLVQDCETPFSIAFPTQGDIVQYVNGKENSCPSFKIELAN